MDYKITTVVGNELEIKGVDNIDYSHDKVIAFHSVNGIEAILLISQVIEIIGTKEGES